MTIKVTFPNGTTLEIEIPMAFVAMVAANAAVHALEMLSR